MTDTRRPALSPDKLRRMQDLADKRAESHARANEVVSNWVLAAALGASAFGLNAALTGDESWLLFASAICFAASGVLVFAAGLATMLSSVHLEASQSWIQELEEETLGNGALPYTPLSWRVTFTIDAGGSVQNGLLTLQGGRSFALEGTSKFNVASSLSSLKLQTADKGIKIQLKKVLLDDEASPPAVVGGSLAYKILGQSGKADVPAPAP